MCGCYCHSNKQLQTPAHKPLYFIYETQIKFKGFIMLQQINLFELITLHLWPSQGGTHEQKWGIAKKCL